MYEILAAANARYTTHVTDRVTRVVVSGTRDKSPYRCGNIEMFFNPEGVFLKFVGYNDDVPDLDTIWRRLKYVVFGTYP
jgi:hypothetical protein